MYVIISATPPFDDDVSGFKRICGRIFVGEWAFDVEEFDAVSANCLDLIRRLLQVDRHLRFYANQALCCSLFHEAQ